jgi:hypothetical protein
MKGLRIVLAAIMVGLTTIPGNSHSWYPKECCSDKDCTSVDRLYTDPNGNRIVKLGRFEIWIPRALIARSSPDGRVHICLGLTATPEGDISTLPICLFLPAEG